MSAFKAEEQSQLQIMERGEINDAKYLVEAIDELMTRVKKMQDVCMKGLLLMFTLDVTAHGTNTGDVHVACMYTRNGLVMHAKMSLTGFKGLSDSKVDMMCEAVEKSVNSGYITRNDALLERKTVVGITSGSQTLDELFLGGGVETSAGTDAFGVLRSGNTQKFPHTLCVSTQFPINMRGGNGKVAYTDTGRKSVVCIKTGSQAIHELLGGGIGTEAFGEFVRSGKTQLVHTHCVSTQLPINMRGGCGKVDYIDKEGTFKPAEGMQLLDGVLGAPDDCSDMSEVPILMIMDGNAGEGAVGTSGGDGTVRGDGGTGEQQEDEDDACDEGSNSSSSSSSDDDEDDDNDDEDSSDDSSGEEDDPNNDDDDESEVNEIQEQHRVDGDSGDRDASEPIRSQNVDQATSNMAARLNLSAIVADRACALYKSLSDLGCTRGKKLDALRAACVLICSREQGEPCTLTELKLAANGVAPKLIRKKKDVIIKALNLDQNKSIAVQAEDYLTPPTSGWIVAYSNALKKLLHN